MCLKRLIYLNEMLRLRKLCLRFSLFLFRFSLRQKNSCFWGGVTCILLLYRNQAMVAAQLQILPDMQRIYNREHQEVRDNKRLAFGALAHTSL